MRCINDTNTKGVELKHSFYAEVVIIHNFLPLSLAITNLFERILLRGPEELDT